MSAFKIMKVSIPVPILKVNIILSFIILTLEMPLFIMQSSYRKEIITQIYLSYNISYKVWFKCTL